MVLCIFAAPNIEFARRDAEFGNICPVSSQLDPASQQSVYLFPVLRFSSELRQKIANVLASNCEGSTDGNCPQHLG
jgi:hypothetical protein